MAENNSEIGVYNRLGVCFNGVMTTAAPTAYLATECIHGLEPAWCTPCRKAAGYRPGTDRQYGDCAIIAFANVTGAGYDEAANLLAAAGRKAGKGTYEATLRMALAAAGFSTEATPITLSAAVRDGGTYLVIARHGRKGHAYAVVAGQVLNALGYDRGPGVRYHLIAVD
jgi:hypothetical protein